VNILIFPEYPYPTNHVVVETVYEQMLPGRGHTVHMIRPAHNLADVEVRSAPWTSGSLRLFPFEPLGSAANNIRRRLHQRRWLKNLLQGLDDVTVDVVLVRNDLLSARAAFLFSQRRRIPLIYQVSSPDAEFRIRLGREAGFRKGFYSIIRGNLDLWRRRRICRQADVVLCISDAMRDHMVKVEQIDPARTFSFPMGFRNGPLAPNDDVAAKLRELGLPKGKTIVYTGVLDAVRKPEFMLGVLERVVRKVPDAVLLVITQQTDERRVQFENQIARRNLNVKVVGPLHHTEVSRYLSCADVMISPCPPIFEYRISSPTKTFEGLGVGLPVIGNEEVEEHARVLRDSGGGIAVPYDVDTFADAIVSVLLSGEQRSDLGRRGRTWVLNHRTYQHLTDYLEAILLNASSRESLAALPHGCN